jgi:hypothetical protein
MEGYHNWNKSTFEEAWYVIQRPRVWAFAICLMILTSRSDSSSFLIYLPMPLCTPPYPSRLLLEANNRFKRVGPNAMRGRGIGAARGRATIQRGTFFHPSPPFSFLLVSPSSNGEKLGFPDAANNQQTQGEVHQHVHPKVSGDNLVCLLLTDSGKLMDFEEWWLDRTSKKSPCLELDM